MTQKEYQEQLDNNNCNWIVIENYKGNHVPILHKCKLDGYEIKVRPSCLKPPRNQKCPECTRRIKENNFFDKINDSNRGIKIKGKYKTFNNSIKVECNICGYEWNGRPEVLLSGKGCPKCMGHAKINTKEANDRLKNTNPNIELAEELINISSQTLFRCLVDGNVWRARASHVLYGNSSCPYCKMSSGERRIDIFLKDFFKNSNEYFYQYTFDDCKNPVTKHHLPFDFYIPKYNLCIEYQGQQHYYPVDFTGSLTDEEKEEQFRQQKYRDKLKYDYCKNKGINLLEIPYTLYNDIENIIYNQFTTINMDK